MAAAPGGRNPRMALLLTSLPLALLGALCVPLILWRLGGPSLVNGDEALYHGVAEGMVRSGDWWTLRFRSELRVYDTFMNAPLHYWARAALIEAFGSSAWTARLLSGLCGVGAVLATARLAAELDPRRSPWPGFAAGLALLTCFQFVWLHGARTGELDTAVALCLLLAALCFLRACDRPAPASFWAHHASLAVLLTLKLPLVLVPLAAEAVFFAAVPSARSHLRRWLWQGAAVAPVALLWHAGQALALGDAFAEVLRTMGGQATGGLGARVGSGGQATYYAGVVLFGAWPHALAWPLALLRVLQRAAAGAARVRWLVPALFALAVLGFFLVVSKRAPWYVLPAYPFLCVFLGHWLGDLARRRPQALDAAAVGFVAAGVAWVAVPLSGYNPFALPAVHMPMPVALRGEGVLAAAGALATLAAVGAGLQVLRIRRPARAGPVFASLLGLLLFLPAGVRVAAPLAFLGWQSPLAQLARSLEAERAAGRPLPDAVEVPSASVLLTRFYFGDHWRVVPARGAGGEPQLRIVRRAE